MLTPKGTVLHGSTFQKVQFDLEAFLFSQRTGVNMDASVRLPWKKIFETLKLDSSELDVSSKKVLFTYLETSLDEYVAKLASSNSGGKTLKPEYAKDMSKLLHQILKGSENNLDIVSVATVYAIKTERPLNKDSLEEIREQMRIFLGSQPEPMHFLLQRGPMGVVTRLLDEKGRPTGAELPEAKSSPARSQTFERWSQKLAQAVPGITVGLWNKLKGEIPGKEYTKEQIETFLAKQNS